MQVKRSNGFLTKGESRNRLILVQEQTVATILLTLQRVWHGIYPGAKFNCFLAIMQRI